MKAFLIAAGLLALQPAIAAAQDAGGLPPPPPPGGGMRGGMGMGGMADVRTRADVEAMVKARFARMDANGDGVVTRAEYDAFRASRMARRGGGDMPPPPPEGGPDGDMGGPPPPPGAMSGGGMGGRGDWFARNDADGDGRVTLAEAMRMPLAMFDRADTNHDGTLSDKEREAAMERMMEMRERRGGEQ